MASIEFTSQAGAIGDIQPGWSVTEDATPLAPGDVTGGTGQVSLSSSGISNPEFVIDNEYTFRESGASVSGFIDVVNVGGKGIYGEVSIQGNTILQALNADRVAPPVWRGKGAVPPSVTFGDAVGSVTNPWGVAASAAYVYVTSRSRGKVLRFDANTGAFLNEWGSIGAGPGQFSTGPVDIAVNQGDGGNVFVTDPGGNRIQVFSPDGTFVRQFSVPNAGYTYISCDSMGNIFTVNQDTLDVTKFGPTGAPLANFGNPYGAGYLPSGVGVDANDNVIVSWLSVAPEGGIVTVYGNSLSPTPIHEFRDGFKLAEDSSSNGIYSLTASENSTFWGFPRWGNFIVRMDYSGREIERFYPSDTGSPDALGLYALASLGEVLYALMAGNSSSQASRWNEFTGNVVEVFDYRQSSLSDAIRSYIDLIDNTITIQYDATTNPNVIFPGWSGNVWKFLSDLCAAYAIEIVRDGLGILVRDIGAREIEIEDVVSGSASMNMTATATGRSVNIVNYNVSAGSGIVYDAAADANGRTLSVGAGEVLTETLQTNTYPTHLNQPTHTDDISVPAGQYFVIASDGLPVTVGAWREYGGQLSVAISKEIPGGIEVTLIGPREEIPGVTAPYSIAISDGSTTRPALSITGSGVFTNPVSVNLLTGASPDRTTQQVALDIDNVFIGNIEQAYDRGAWACTVAAGPSISYQMSVPSASLNGLGGVAGSVLDARSGIYRVSSVSISGPQAGMTCVPMCTTGEFDSQWLGKTTGEFDSQWSGRTTGDFKIKPLLMAGS